MTGVSSTHSRLFGDPNAACPVTRSLVRVSHSPDTHSRLFGQYKREPVRISHSPDTHHRLFGHHQELISLKESRSTTNGNRRADPGTFRAQPNPDAIRRATDNAMRTLDTNQARPATDTKLKFTPAPRSSSMRSDRSNRGSDPNDAPAGGYPDGQAQSGTFLGSRKKRHLSQSSGHSMRSIVSPRPEDMRELSDTQSVARRIRRPQGAPPPPVSRNIYPGMSTVPKPTQPRGVQWDPHPLDSHPVGSLLGNNELGRRASMPQFPCTVTSPSAYTREPIAQLVPGWRKKKTFPQQMAQCGHEWSDTKKTQGGREGSNVPVDLVSGNSAFNRRQEIATSPHRVRRKGATCQNNEFSFKTRSMHTLPTAEDVYDSNEKKYYRTFHNDPRITEKHNIGSGLSLKEQVNPPNRRQSPPRRIRGQSPTAQSDDGFRGQLRSPSVGKFVWRP